MGEIKPRNDASTPGPEYRELQMKKRIRLGQVRVGMFVEELESVAGVPGRHSGPFFINSPADVQRVLKSRAMSVVINTGKGVDADGSMTVVFGSQQFEAALAETFSRREILEARQSVESTMPHIRNLLGEARMSGVFPVDSANAAVEQIMRSAISNPGALLGILRLKNADETTFLHSFAVSALMIAFGRKLELPASEIQLLGFGGLVHDMGKLVLPKQVLGKNGKLDARELAIMREHPQRGHELLQKIEGIHPIVLDVCLYHHERYDGAGYPHGLYGESIPFAARIAAICDVYEAMTTVRPYKRAWSQADTVNLMMRSSGHFDPALLGTFVSSMIVSGLIR